MMYPFVVGLFISSALTCCGQSVSTRLGGRQAAMGYASFTISDEATLFNNVGALANLEHSAVFFSYEAAAEIPGANRTGFAWSALSPIGAIALGLFRFGDNLYSEQMLSAGFSNKIGITSLGARLNYVQYRADGFGTRSTLTLDAGGLTQLTPQISIGAGIFNVTQAKIAEGEELPVTLVVAIAFQADHRFNFIVEVEKRTAYPLIIKGGMEYGIYKKLFIRSGINIHPTAAYGGIGAKASRVSFDYAIKVSSTLGFAHQASASYRLAIRKKK